MGSSEVEAHLVSAHYPADGVSPLDNDASGLTVVQNCLGLTFPELCRSLLDAAHLAIFLQVGVVQLRQRPRGLQAADLSL